MPNRPLAFPDLEFQYRQALCRYSDGPLVKRWMPFGMPRLRPKFETCAFFLFRKDENTGERSGPLGSGFYVARWWRSNSALSHTYAVTNWHVAVKMGASSIRVNTLSGEPVWIDLTVDEWQFVPGSHDVAMVDITDAIPPEDEARVDILAIHEDTFADASFIQQVGLGRGDDVFMMGMFGGDEHRVDSQNYPVARFGNIARLADPNILIRQENKSRQPCHLIDMRSRGGHSGSPVFVYRTPDGDLSEVAGEGGSWTLNPINNLFMKLLGVHVGQYDDEVKVRVGRRRTKPEQLGEEIREGDSLYIPGGVTTVAPVFAIVDLLELPFFRNIRMGREKKDGDQSKQIPVAEGLEPKIKGDANPDHRGDFTRLLNAAAKTKPQVG